MGTPSRAEIVGVVVYNFGGDGPSISSPVTTCGVRPRLHVSTAGMDRGGCLRTALSGPWTLCQSKASRPRPD